MSNRLEREQLKLKARILRELEKQELLKKAILDELNQTESDRKSRLSKFLGHPAFLLFLGFFFTGVIGAGLSVYWQGNEWLRQQSLLAHQQTLAKKYELANEVSKAIGEMHAAASGVLNTIQQEDDDRRREKVLAEPIKNWRQARQRWIVDSSILLQKLTVYFPSDPQNPTEGAELMFEDIINGRKQRNNDVDSILFDLNSGKGKMTPEIKQEVELCVKNLNGEQKDLARKLLGFMAEEIHKDAKLPKPQGLRSLLRQMFQ